VCNLLHPAWLVSLTVRHGLWVVILENRKISSTIPWHAPDIFLEASAPDKLPSEKLFRKKTFS